MAGSLKRVLNILKSPTMEERAAFTAFFAALQQFELARREQLKEVRNGRRSTQGHLA
jgi:hypothetical protein